MSNAIIFPGQGAQFVGMGKELYEASEDVRALYRQASGILGVDIATISFEGPEDELKRSDRTQPAIFLHSVAALMAVKDTLDVAATAGHSFGEWTALYYAGAISLEDVLVVLEARGRFMQEACTDHPGGMLAVMGLDRAGLDAICEETGIEIANLNSPVQTILSGLVSGVEAAEPLAKEKGAKRAMKLPVAGAFHSSLMAGAAKKFAEVLAGITLKVPERPVMCNVTGKVHGDDPEEIKRLMVAQITSSVEWIQNIETLAAMGVTDYIECGPGKVLTGLIKRIATGANLHNIQTDTDAASVLQTLGIS